VIEQAPGEALRIVTAIVDKNACHDAIVTRLRQRHARAKAAATDHPAKGDNR
jgi:hypothetical protein